jgi:hypothetical protein
MWTRPIAGCLTVVALGLGAVRNTSAQTVQGHASSGLLQAVTRFEDFSGTHLAGGADVLFNGAAGITGEVGALVAGGSPAGVTSVGGILQARASRMRRALPFVTGGYTMLWSEGESVDGWFVGGGVTWWTSQRLGVRLELRDHIVTGDREAKEEFALLTS